MIRDGDAIPVREVLAAVRASKDGSFNVRGYRYRRSLRMQCFAYLGVTCHFCGKTGTRFYKERHRNSERFHLNLYAVGKRGKEILMTLDHIVPLSRGGANNLNNAAPCCLQCNTRKGNGDTPWSRAYRPKGAEEPGADYSSWIRPAVNEEACTDILERFCNILPVQCFTSCLRGFPR